MPVQKQSPLFSFSCFVPLMAQRIEQQRPKLRVAGSNPAEGTAPAIVPDPDREKLGNVTACYLGPTHTNTPKMTPPACFSGSTGKRDDCGGLVGDGKPPVQRGFPSPLARQSSMGGWRAHPPCGSMVGAASF